MNVNGKFLGFIPSVTTAAGASLTAKNLSDAGIHWVSLNLTSLLVKPGYSVLTALKNLQQYADWGKNIILDASSLTANKNGKYKIRSSYDGSFIEHTEDEILNLLVSLKPNICLLPGDIAIENSIRFTPKVLLFDGVNWNEFLHNLSIYSAPYVIGDFTQQQMLEIAEHKVLAIQSDKPAQDAVHGIVYLMDGNLALQDSQFELDFRQIDHGCNCPTCAQKFTRAYLHHLFTQTPLLCQRLLIQHNFYHCQSLLSLHG